jgi:TetR/AcrR family transcriptional regulator, regulator of mycofactocin system
MHSRTASRPLHARKQDFVRNAIWEVAVDLFADKGFTQTTVEDIARAAGVSRRTFFRYFSSKDDLMVQAMNSYGDLVSHGIRDGARRQRPLEMVRAAVLTVAEHVVAQPRTRTIMKILEDDPAARAAQLSRFDDIKQRLAATFATRLHQRSTDYTPAVLASLTLLVLDLTFRAWYEREAERPEDTVDEIFSTLRDVICGNTPLDRVRRRRAARR